MGPIRVTPGFVSGSSAQGLNEMAAQSALVRADMERMKVTRTGDFPAKLTAYDAVTGFYSWTRQTFDSSMARYDYPEAFGGTATYSPARTMNGEVIDVTTAVQVWLRPVGTSATLGTVYEVVAGVRVGGFVRFTLPSALLTTEESKALCTVDDYWGGGDPGATVTVYNLPASTNYMFSGSSGNKGLATWDDLGAKWFIIQLECP